MMNFIVWLTNIERISAETYEQMPTLYKDKVRLNFNSYCESCGYAV